MKVYKFSMGKSFCNTPHYFANTEQFFTYKIQNNQCANKLVIFKENSLHYTFVVEDGAAENFDDVRSLVR